MEGILDSWIMKQKIAHRGLHDNKNPENSLGAIKRAMEKGFAVEIDVHLISDGEIVVIHDDTLSRTTNNKGLVADLKTEDLKNVYLKRSKETLPTLVDVLKCVKGKVPILIEIKNAGRVGELERTLYEAMKNYKGKYAIQSFNPFVLKWFRINAPEVWRGQLSCTFRKEKMSIYRKMVLRRMLLNERVSKPNFISYEYGALPNKYVKKYGELPLLAWVVRDNRAMRFAKEGGADNFIFENFIPKNVFNK